METEALKQLLNALKEKDAKNRIETSVDGDGILQLFVQLEFQQEWFHLYGQLIHIDGTFKVNCENYLLYVIMAQNSNGKGRPVAYCWMKSETKENLEFLYRLLKLTPHIPEIKIILVDKDLTNLEVLRAAFSDSKILLCSFHVIKW